MTEAILGIGLVCLSASLCVFAHALRRYPISPGSTDQIITTAQWGRLRRRAAAERNAAPPAAEGTQAISGRIS